MDKTSKAPTFLRKKVGLYILIFLMAGLFIVSLSLELTKEVGAESQLLLTEEQVSSDFLIIQGNSLQPTKNPLNPGEIIVSNRIEVVVTGYSSTPWETDDTPYLTAAGTLVKEGIVATNILPFGTKIRLPEIYGDKIFVVEDRMKQEKNYHIDIWFPSYSEALNFGVKKTYIEILKG